jgi:hypothetical protein
MTIAKLKRADGCISSSSLTLPAARLLRFANQPFPEESMTARKTKILLDGGDAQETQRILKGLGFLDGQTTNPSLIAKNPDIRRLVASEHGLSVREQMDEYRNIVRAISSFGRECGSFHRGLR